MSVSRPSLGVAAFWGCSLWPVSSSSLTPLMTLRTSGGTPSCGSLAAARRTGPSWQCWKEGCPDFFMSRISCTTTSLRTVAWCSRVLISASLALPVLLVLSRTRTVLARSWPARGSCAGPSLASSPGFRAASAWASCACRFRSTSSQGSGKVRALPRVPSRCRAQWAFSSSVVPSLRCRASMDMQIRVVTHGLAQIISMTVLRGGSVPSIRCFSQSWQRGTSQCSQSTRSLECCGFAGQRRSSGQHRSLPSVGICALHCSKSFASLNFTPPPRSS